MQPRNTERWLEADGSRGLQAVSLLDRLPAGERTFGPPSSALATPEGVYFAARRRLFFFPLDDAAPARVWPLPAPFASMWRMDGELHVALENGAWRRLHEGEFTVVAKDQPPVFAARSAAEGAAVLLTRRGPRVADALSTDAATALGDGLAAGRVPERAQALQNGPLESEILREGRVRVQRIPVAR